MEKTKYTALLFIGFGYWAKGETFKTALANYKKISGGKKDFYTCQMWGADEPFAKIGTDEDGPTFSFTGDSVKFEKCYWLKTISREENETCEMFLKRAQKGME